MKVMAFNGSPRKRNWNTVTLLNEALARAMGTKYTDYKRKLKSRIISGLPIWVFLKEGACLQSTPFIRVSRISFPSSLPPQP
jgi:hypothetical protein